MNTRSTDETALGIVSDRYKVVQNEDAFRFTDDLLGEGVVYETAGALQGGRKVWMLARMPEKYIIAGDEITPYMVVMNSHDGSSGIKVAMTPIRVVCQNTLNLALNTAKRIWTTKHTENVMSRVYEAKETLSLAGQYNIAQRIAYIMGTGFHCKVLGYDPFVNAEEAEKRGFEKVETVEELLERSDLVNVNVPLVKSTKNLINQEEMRHFKPGAVFVNAARGEIIDEDALYDALVDGRLRAAACDTFVEEPVSPNNKLLTLRNFSATPHLGGNTEESLQRTGVQVVRDTLNVLSGDFSTVHCTN